MEAFVIRFDPSSPVNLLVDRFWEAILEQSPTTATIYGDERYDDRLEDPSALGRARARERAETTLRAALAIEADDQPLEVGNRSTAHKAHSIHSPLTHQTQRYGHRQRRSASHKNSRKGVRLSVNPSRIRARISVGNVVHRACDQDADHRLVATGRAMPAPCLSLAYNVSSVVNGLVGPNVVDNLGGCQGGEVNSRLGLRAGEFAALQLDDIDWRAGS